ncbi:MAG TPA: hypothetical protein VMC62_03325 [Longilinea sp.]|nr:hypothetical protein [Longilinea sp.]
MRTLIKLLFFVAGAMVIYYLDTATRLDHFMVFVISLLALVVYRLFVTTVHGLPTMLMLLSSSLTLYLWLIVGPGRLVPMPIFFLFVAASAIFTLWDFLS